MTSLRHWYQLRKETEVKNEALSKHADRAIEYSDAVPTDISDPSAPTLASMNESLNMISRQLNV